MKSKVKGRKKNNADEVAEEIFREIVSKDKRKLLEILLQEYDRFPIWLWKSKNF